MALAIGQWDYPASSVPSSAACLLYFVIGGFGFARRSTPYTPASAGDGISDFSAYAAFQHGRTQWMCLGCRKTFARSVLLTDSLRPEFDLTALIGTGSGAGPCPMRGHEDTLALRPVPF